MPKRKKKGSRFKKRENSTGSIILLKGNRRKPYCVRVCVGRNEDRELIRKNIGYFETYEEASDYLDMYNLMKKKKDSNRLTLTDEQAKYVDADLFENVKNVLENQKAMLTFKEIFDILYQERYQYEKGYKSKLSWFKHLEKLHDRKIDTISLFDLQECFDCMKDTHTDATLTHMKSICTDVFEYAVIHEYIKRDMDFTSYIDTKSNKKLKQKHKPFSIEEIRTLIKDDSLAARFCLIFIFTGCRPNELLSLDTSNIHLDEASNDDGNEKVISYVVTGSKTDAGKNRVIPIHDMIKPYIVELLKEHKDYLILKTDRKYILQFYKKYYFNVLMDKYNMDHTPYDCRHTFSTLAKLNKVDEYCRKKIMGHKSNDLTDDVYTHAINNKLFDEMQKIKA